MTDATQLPQVLIVTGDYDNRIAFEIACRGKLESTVLYTDKEISTFREVINTGSFVAVIAGLIMSQRVRVSPTQVTAYARNQHDDILIIGVCTNQDWRDMITKTGATHAVATPAEAIKLITNHLTSRG